MKLWIIRDIKTGFAYASALTEGAAKAELAKRGHVGGGLINEIDVDIEPVQFRRQMACAIASSGMLQAMIATNPMPHMTPQAVAHIVWNVTDAILKGEEPKGKKDA